MLEFVNLKGENVDLTKRAETAKTFGSWLCETPSPSEIVDWCNHRIKMYETWTKECNRLKAQVQSVQVGQIPVNVRLKGLTKEEIQQYLDTLG